MGRSTCSRMWSPLALTPVGDRKLKHIRTRAAEASAVPRRGQLRDNTSPRAGHIGIKASWQAPVSTPRRDTGERSAKAVPSARCLTYRGLSQERRRESSSFTTSDVRSPDSQRDQRDIFASSNSAAADGCRDVWWLRLPSASPGLARKPPRGRVLSPDGAESIPVVRTPTPTSPGFAISEQPPQRPDKV
jgi:hypothetical protein